MHLILLYTYFRANAVTYSDFQSEAGICILLFKTDNLAHDNLQFCSSFFFFFFFVPADDYNMTHDYHDCSPTPYGRVKGPVFLKGIFSDPNIFIWHESEDINKIFLCFQVMHDCVCFIAPIDYLC